MNNLIAQDLTGRHIDSLAYAYGIPLATAELRNSADDFKVRETLSFVPSGNGCHAYLKIQKRLLTTEEVVKRVAKLTGLSPRHIGYAGLKDRNAQTTQWFSVDLSGKAEPDWRQLESDRLRVIETSRHERKLKRGAIESNSFHLTLRNVAGDTADIERRLAEIKKRGVPNYFGEQRFGIQEANLHKAYDMLANNKKVKNRHLRSLYYSAARSYLFNLVLSQRVMDGSWDQAINGDVMVLNGSRSFFVSEQIEDGIIKRVTDADIHPSGPLWGKGQLLTQANARQLELAVLKEFSVWTQGLEQHGLEQQRRALRVLAEGVEWNWDTGRTRLSLSFKLISGSYATGVVREVLNY